MEVYLTEDKMDEDEIAIRLLGGIVSAARSILGDDAIKHANEVGGLRVRQTGEVVVSGEVLRIVGLLCREYEKALKGRLVLDVDVRLNIRRNGV